VDSLLTSGVQAATVRSRQLGVRFAAWLGEEGELDVDPLLGKAPKLESKVIEPLTDARMEALLKACAGKDLRDRGIAARTSRDGADLWLAGVRLDDLLDDAGRVDPDEGTAAVTHATEDGPHWRRPAPSYDGGARGARAWGLATHGRERPVRPPLTHDPLPTEDAPGRATNPREHFSPVRIASMMRK